MRLASLAVVSMRTLPTKRQPLPVEVDDDIVAIARSRHVLVRAVAAVQPVIASAAVENILARPGDEVIVAAHR